MRVLSLLVVTLAVAAASPAVASAAPANDAFAAAVDVGSLPFETALDVNGGTTEPGEPQFCNFQSQTVWYRIATGAPTAVRARMDGSDFGVVFNVYRAFGPGLGSLAFAGCAGFGGSVQLRVEPGETYYVQAGSVSPGPALLRLQLTSVPPPPNDAFADAKAIATLPYFDSVDGDMATLEAGEPQPSRAFTPIVASAWYSYTAAADGPLTAATSSSGVSPILGVYTGASLASLAEVASTSQSSVTFRAVAGTTYRFQLGRGFAFGSAAPLGLRLEVAPPLTASFSWFPFDPSTFDDVSFVDTGFDPAATIVMRRWSFGDGGTAEGCCPVHRYAADGDYLVTLQIESEDGRTASTTRTVQVRTRDVGITKLEVPHRAPVGATRTIAIAVGSSRSAETVRVVLMRSVGGVEAYEPVGSATGSVPAGGARTRFDIPYTFRPDDGVAGKVTFRATAVIEGGRDAAPADNTVTSVATIVRR